jgi:citrate lyase beta subunit
VQWANEIWTPTDDEIDGATRAIAVYEQATARGEGVAFVDGRLIDMPAVRLAHAVLAAARPTAGLTTDQRGA